MIDVPRRGRRAQTARALDRNTHLRNWLRAHHRPTPCGKEQWLGLLAHLQAFLPDHEAVLYLKRKLRPGQTRDDAGVRWMKWRPISISYAQFGKDMHANSDFWEEMDGIRHSIQGIPCENESVGVDDPEESDMPLNALTPISLLTADELAEAKHAALKKEIEKGCQQRTQEAADRMFEGAHRWSVEVWYATRKHDARGPIVKRDLAWPTIVVRAASEQEARWRYCALCGILSMDVGVELRLTPLPDDGELPTPPAPAPTANTARDEYLPAGCEPLAME